MEVLLDQIENFSRMKISMIQKMKISIIQNMPDIDVLLLVVWKGTVSR